MERWQTVNAMARTADPSVRTALIEAAAERLSTDGLDALSVRSLADEVGASTTALYTHFGSKDDLVREVVREAFHRLHAEMAAIEPSDDPVADLAETGLAYRRNALANPHLYRVMFERNPLGLGTHDSPTHHHANPAIGLEAFGALVAAVTRCTDAGRLEGDPTELALICWAAAHGAVMLELAGFLGDDGEAVFVATTTAVLRSHLR